ncbi:MAG: alpha/beta hydrolase [Candidatus Sumerlaeota bacterium]|nr:alpha/beta hydrolase [Candidatus Sumerlaeota bacterium]
MEYSRQPDLENVSYGPHPRNVLDLWKAKSDQPTPAVVYFHPGGFNHGDRRGGTTGLPPELLEACLAKGISVAAANYRLSSQAPYPTQMEDGARAIQFLRYHAKEWNLNPRAMAAEGGSAGADTSLWLAFRDDMADPASTDPVKRQSTRLPVVGCVDAQCSLDPRVIAKIVDENTARVMGTMALATLFGLPKDEDLMKAERSFPLFEDASAVNHLKPGASPAFLYYTGPPRPAPTGDRNTDVHSIRFGYYLKERMDKLGIECVLRHSGEYTGDRKAQFYGDMVDFFLKHFPGKGE